MSEANIYGIIALLICFTLTTLWLGKIEPNEDPEEYYFSKDPYWPIITIILLGSCTLYFMLPDYYDTVNNYSFFDFLLPPLFSSLIYFSFLMGFNKTANFLILIFATVIVLLLPDTFVLFPKLPFFWLDRVIIVVLLWAISHSLPLLNGIGALASIQILTLSVISFMLSYLGFFPQLLTNISLVYAGVITAFLFFSWPPEKLVLNQVAFTSIGFILGCYMLYGAIEFVEAPMLIGCSFMVSETLCALYSRYICHIKKNYLYMNTIYYQVAETHNIDIPVLKWLLKIFVIDVILAVMQITSKEQLALPIFSIVLNFWFLSILSGDTKPEELLSLTGWGRKSIKKIFTKNNKKNSD